MRRHGLAALRDAQVLLLRPWSQRRSQAFFPGAAMHKWLVGNPASCETVNLRNVRLLSTGAEPCRSRSRARAAAVRCGFRSPRTRPVPTSSAIAQSAARPWEAAASPSTSWATRGAGRTISPAAPTRVVGDPATKRTRPQPGNCRLGPFSDASVACRAPTASGEIEAVQVHHLAPRRHEVFHELLL
jgi:hypothetical protein